MKTPEQYKFMAEVYHELYLITRNHSIDVDLGIKIRGKVEDAIAGTAEEQQSVLLALIAASEFFMDDRDSDLKNVPNAFLTDAQKARKANL